MITVGKFCRKDIDKLQISREEKAEMVEYYDLYLAGDNSPAFNVRNNKEICGMAGIRLISRYVGEAWMCWNPDFFNQHKKTVIVKIKDYIDFIGIIFKLKKIQAIIDVKRDIDKRFIEFLGFRYEKKLESGFDIYVKGV